MNRLHPDRLDFPIEPEIGRAGRWNASRAMRVLAWTENVRGRPKRAP